MNKLQRSKTRSSFLRLESLEGRDVPAGVVTVSLSGGGALSLTGDDRSNVITNLKVEAAQVTVTPDATTDVGAGIGNPKVFAGAVTSLKATLKGGDDEIFIDPTSDFILTGAANIDLGDGTNTFEMITTAKVELGSLTYKGGDGTDSVSLEPGAGLGKVTGTASINGGPGPLQISLTETTFSGSGGLKAVAGSFGFMTLSANNITVAKTVNLTTGDYLSSLNFSGGNGLGGLKSTGTFALIGLDGITVNGAVSSTSTIETALITNNTKITGNVTLKSPLIASLKSSGTFESGNISISATQPNLFQDAAYLEASGSFKSGNISISASAHSAHLTSMGTLTANKVSVSAKVNGIVSFGTSAITGDISVKAGQKAELDDGTALTAKNVSLTSTGYATSLLSGGTFVAGNVTLSGGVLDQIAFNGPSATINGNFSATSKLSSQLNFATTNTSEVKGTFKVKGSSLQNLIFLNSKFQADKDVSLTLGNAINQVSIGDGSSTLQLLGKLTVKGGTGLDLIALRNVAVAGVSSITLGAGTDQLSIDDGSKFTGALTVDMGSGDDVISIATDTSATATVDFNGKATIKMGSGNDSLVLGVGTGGTAFTKVNFNGAGSKIDGGSNFNTFDDGAPMNFSGLTFGTSIVNFTDPNP